MPLILPHAPQFSLFETNLPANPSFTVPGIAVSNPAGAANTKDTTWTQMVASTAADYQCITVSFFSSSASNTDTSTLIDIGIGASTAETVIIPDLLAGFCGAPNVAARHYIFPLRIPSGSRVSARSQSVRTTGSTVVLINLYGGPRNPDAWWAGSTVTAYGINLADSGAVSVTAGNSGAETGTPVSIGTTTSHHECLVVGTQGNKGTYSANLGYYWDVGIDTASTAWLQQDGFYMTHGTTEQVSPGGVWWPIFAPVPSGSVLVMGGECSGTAETLDFALYGIS